jgi:hypothetical protein
MSSINVRTPELTSKAAMPPPMTPDPITAAFLIFFIRNLLPLIEMNEHSLA